jgi:hypothetical protein
VPDTALLPLPSPELPPLPLAELDAPPDPLPGPLLCVPVAVDVPVLELLDAAVSVLDPAAPVIAGLTSSKWFTSEHAPSDTSAHNPKSPRPLGARECASSVPSFAREGRIPTIIPLESSESPTQARANCEDFALQKKSASYIWRLRKQGPTSRS